MKKYIYILLFISISANCQEKALLKADQKFQKEQYIDAIKIYEQLAKKGVASIEIYQRLGDSYYFNANYEKAFVWYQKLYELNANCSSEYLYRYAQCLKSTGNYDQAKTILGKYSIKEKAEIRSDLFLKFNGKANTNDKLSSAFNVMNLGINSTKSDYGGILKGDTIVFASARNQNLANIIYKRTNQSFTNLYYSTIKSLIDIPEPKLFSKKTFSKFHEATPTFSKDGKTMYFTQNEVKKNNKGKAVNGLYKIYKSELINGNWNTPIKIQIEADDLARIAHPALSSDEKYLYFASDMKGTFGASDLFKIKINENGTYGKPENLGSKINTEGRESYPFITKDNKLLFASDGQPGYGGFDIFVLDLDNPNALPINLGTKINSPMDDFAMVWNRETRLGTFTSNRKGGVGDDDIYLIEEVVPFNFEVEIPVKGTLQDLISKDFLQDAQVVLLDIKGNIIAVTKTDDKGNYSFDKIKTNQTYKIRIEKEGYETQQKTITVSQYETEINVPVVVSAIKVKIDKGVDIAIVIKFNQIYFDLDKSDIRKDAKVELEKIVEVLKTYPKIKIEIGSHTDARQHRKYNKILSQKRAEATLNYLVKRGISTSRLTAKGYGESQLVNQCADGIICSEKEHQQNRRSSFIIVE
jgi:outer membrane protein OmpA-like peptidoglycan-associated protein/tetratricopeptide (TPR) repeat protein